MEYGLPPELRLFYATWMSQRTSSRRAVRLLPTSPRSRRGYATWGDIGQQWNWVLRTSALRAWVRCQLSSRVRVYVRHRWRKIFISHGRILGYWAWCTQHWVIGHRFRDGRTGLVYCPTKSHYQVCEISCEQAGIPHVYSRLKPHFQVPRSMKTTGRHHTWIWHRRCHH